MPTAVVIGGVNGAGKTTASRSLLAEQLAMTAFVNADVIATGISAFAPSEAALAAGGHDVPEVTIRQRYHRSLANFWHAFRRNADVWAVHDNSGTAPVLISEGRSDLDHVIHEPLRWAQFAEAVADARNRDDG